jgi:PAS domain S-box-containing protein
MRDDKMRKSMNGMSGLLMALSQSVAALPAVSRPAFRRRLDGLAKDLAGLRSLVEGRSHSDRARADYLASFPELNPDPVMEVGPKGHVNYLNPAAERFFPGLRNKGARHPWLAGIRKVAASLKKSQKSSLTRDVKIGREWFAQNIVLDQKSATLRIYGRHVTERKRTEELTRRQNVVLRGINRILSETLACTTEAQLGRICLKVAKEATGSQMGFIAELNAEGSLDDIAVDVPGKCAAFGTFGGQRKVPRKDFEIKGLFEHVLKTEKPFFTNDPSPRKSRISLPAGHPPLTAFLGVPMRYRGRVIGMVGLANREEGYGDEDKEFLEALVPSIVQALMRHRAERALRESEDRERRRSAELEAIMEALPTGIAILDAKGGNVRSNSAFERVWGGPRPLTRSVRDYARYQAWWMESDRKVKSNEWASAIALRDGKTVANQAMRISRFDGSETFVLNGAAPILDAAGTIVGSAVAIQDISELIRVQKTLRGTEERYRALVELSPDAVVVYQDERIVYANPAALRLFGADAPDGLLGRNIFDFIHPEERQDVRSRAKRAEHGIRMSAKEARIVRLDGSVLTVEANGGLVEWEGAAAVQTIMRDISELKKSEEKLCKLNQTLAALSKSNQALMRAENEPQYLRDVCRIIVEDCGHAMVWIGYAENDEARTVRPVASAGFEEGYLETLQITWADTERGRGPTGTAIRTGTPSLCRNMLTDPKFEPWRTEALKRGYASSVVLPMLSSGKAIGAVSIYSREPDGFDTDEIELLEELADDLARGVASLRLRAAHALAEEALRESEQRYRSLFRGMTEGFALHEIICGADGVPVDYRFLDINPAFERLTGLKRDEVLGRTMKEVLPGEDPSWIKAYGAVALTGAAAHFENFSPVLGKTYEVYCYRPSPGRFAVLFMDVTERRRIEEEVEKYRTELEEKVKTRTLELAQTTELLERVFASVDLSIAYLDKELHFVRVNRAFAGTFGGEPDSYIGQNLLTLFPDPGLAALFKRVVEAGEPYVEFEGHFSPSGGQGPGLSYWDWSLQPVAVGGVTSGIVLSLVNVTQRVKAEEEARRLVTAVDQSSEAIAITNLENLLVYVNQTFEALHGLSRAEVLGRKYGDLLRFQSEEEAFRQGVREAMARGEVWKGRLTRPIGGQSERKLDITISPVRDPSGQIVNYAILERDMTRELRLEASVRQLQKMDALGTLAGGIAHDFNNILVPIILNTEMALFDAPKDSPLHRYLSLVLEATKRGRDLVGQIIAFSRQKEQKRETLDVALVMREALKLLRSTLPTSIDIHESILTDRGFIRGDSGQIHQVLMNLGNNAAYAMREGGGELDIGLTEVEVDPETAAQYTNLKPGPHLKLTVRDTGMGMTPEVLEKAFDPFFTTKKPGEGAGMGLSVVLGIVKRHGGAITASSEPGKGTAVFVFLPRTAALAGASAGKERSIPKGKGRILFIDDEEVQARTIPPMLERLGYTVTAKIDAQEALSLFRERPEDFDLVMTDQTMPRMSGLQLAAEMLRIRPGVSVLLCTGFSEIVHEEEARAHGLAGFVLKPFSIGEIAEKIHSILKSRSGRAGRS